MDRRKFLKRIGVLGAGVAVAPSVILTDNFSAPVGPVLESWIAVEELATQAEARITLEHYAQQVSTMMDMLHFNLRPVYLPPPKSIPNIESSAPWQVTSGVK